MKRERYLGVFTNKTAKQTPFTREILGVFTNKTAKQTLFDTREIPQREILGVFTNKTAKQTPFDTREIPRTVLLKKIKKTIKKNSIWGVLYMKKNNGGLYKSLA